MEPHPPSTVLCISPLATGTRPSVVVQVLMELNDTILRFGRRCPSVELPGMGTFLPTVKGDGWIRVFCGLDRRSGPCRWRPRRITYTT